MMSYKGYATHDNEVAKQVQRITMMSCQGFATHHNEVAKQLQHITYNDVLYAK